jgi:hypothetical protein
LHERLAQMARRHPPALPAWSPEAEEEVSREELGAEIARRADALVLHLGRIWEAFSGALEDAPPDHPAPVRAILEHARSVDERLPEHARLVVQISTAAAHLDVAWLVVGPVGGMAPAG